MSAMNRLTEDSISLSQAAREIPRLEGGKPIHVATCCRRARRGLRGVKPETVKIGQQSFTTHQAPPLLEAMLAAAGSLGFIMRHPIFLKIAFALIQGRLGNQKHLSM